MNAKKCKQLRRLARVRTKAAGLAARTHYITGKRGKIVTPVRLAPACTRAVYQKLKAAQ